MRNELLALCGVLTWIASGTLALAQDKPTGAPPSGTEVVQTVMGHNDPAVDVAAVQKAVDQGGTVLLKGEFDFGDKGSVTIARDVRVIGEVDDRGGPRTTIKGGQATLRSVRPEAPAALGPKITIQHIHFDGASLTPIQVAYASGATITGNLITRVRPVAFPPDAFSGGKPYNMQHGIVLMSGKSAAYQPDAVTGMLTITDNEIDLANDAPTTTLGMAIWLAHTTGVNANIARNTVRNASRNGIEELDNFRGSDGKGQIAIQDNNVETPAEGVPIPSPNAPNGILIGYFRDKTAALDAKRAIPHVVIHNTVRARGQTSGSFGIAVLMDGALVRDNHVTIEGQGARAISVGGSHNYIGQNLIDGAGVAGVVLAPYPPMAASDNELVRNEVGQLKSTRADVVLMNGANNNIITGSNGTVSDLGSGNVTQGLKPVAAGSAK